MSTHDDCDATITDLDSDLRTATREIDQIRRERDEAEQRSNDHLSRALEAEAECHERRQRANAHLDRAEQGEARAAAWWEAAKTYARLNSGTRASVAAWGNYAQALIRDRYRTIQRAEKAEARYEDLAARFGSESTVMTIRGLVCRTCRQEWMDEEADHA